MDDIDNCTGEANPKRQQSDNMGRLVTVRELVEVIEACQRMVSDAQRAAYEAQRRIAKFERIFERILQEEVALRLNPDKRGEESCGAIIGQLEHLKYKLAPNRA